MELTPFRPLIENSVRRILFDPDIELGDSIIPVKFFPGKKVVRAHVSLFGRELLQAVTAIILKRLHPSSNPTWCMKSAEMLLDSLPGDDIRWAIDYLNRITAPLRLV
jgi:hypothetical protein